ncbi:MAG: adenylyltransferase/cytidyltransferase family protein [Ruminococcus flavefaciens]|nr:adenylyltransferase/cytidyltransferase family protein [Ruminococcus flavefaciens]
MTIGYTTGVFDLFHIGHLNLLKNAKGMCDKLIVGVTVDELVMYKGKHPIITFNDRIEIVRSCKYVDVAIPQHNIDKVEACKKLKANIVFVGDDWYGIECWEEYENRLQDYGVGIVYFPYTENISTTKILEQIQKKDEILIYNERR